MKQVWQCDDGEIFEDLNLAKVHEKEGFNVWLAEMPEMQLSNIWHSMPDTEEDQWVGSEKECGMVFLKAAYQLWCQDNTLANFKRRHAMPAQRSETQDGYPI